MSELDETQGRKQAVRREALARRFALPDKDAKSAVVCERVFDLPEYSSARAVLFYVDARSEVRTRPAISKALASGKKIAVPYCVNHELELFHLHRLDELEPAAFGILEPRMPLRELSDRRVHPPEIDLVLAPGVAFDRRGGRLGHGLGCYDRLLQRLRADAVIAALAFECQVFDEIPMSPHDVFMDYVVTESAVHESRRRFPSRTS